MSESKSPPSSPKARATRRAGKEVPPHIRHVREHLDRVEEGVVAMPNPGDIFLGPADEERFLEVVGLRLLGNPTVVLAALRFRRLAFPGEEHARESLASYFSAPPVATGHGHEDAMEGEMTALLPRWHESIPTFLSRLRAGAHYAPIHFFPRLVQVAFDFRLKNPSALETEKKRAGPMTLHLFRTTAGHVLRGMSHGRSRKRGDDDFISVTGCEQLTPSGAVSLPPVVLHREFVAMSVPLSDEETRLAARHWTPFMPRTGTERHLLLG